MDYGVEKISARLKKGVAVFFCGNFIYLPVLNMQDKNSARKELYGRLYGYKFFKIW